MLSAQKLILVFSHMLISYSWLAEFVDLELGPVELGDRLTLLGLEIDEVRGSGDDTVYDIEVTSNRGDCLSHLGVAREIAAFTGKQIQLPGALADKPVESTRVTIESSELCPRFTARIIRGVKIGPSPDWLVKKLEAVGERSINNVADITNLVMHELGQPMHAFDLSKLTGERILVRTARPGERLKTLDEEIRLLNEGILAICDTEKPVAVAGVMGGFDSGVNAESTDILLEVACFDPDSIRTTSRTLNLATEASHRFERGVDLENLVFASNRASELICNIAGGAASEFSEAYPVKHENLEIKAPGFVFELTRLTGIEIPSAEADRLVTGLGVRINHEGVYIIPSWRHDLSLPEDLVEEAARMFGYEKIGEAIPPARSAGEYQKDEHRKRRVRRALASHGFDEANSYSFIDHKGGSRIASIYEARSAEPDPVIIRDPIIEGADLMRPTLISGLLNSIRLNLNHNIRNLKLFEIGRVFSGTFESAVLPVETDMLAMALTGRQSFEGTAALGNEYDFFDLKAAVEIAVDSAGVGSLTFAATDGVRHLQDGQSALLLLDKKVIGSAGKLRNEIASEFKFKQPVFVAEIDLKTLLQQPETATVYTPLAVYPSVVRDISLIIPKEKTLSDVFKRIRSGSYANFENVYYVDTYEADNAGEKQRSVTIRVEYRSAEKTLEDSEVDRVHDEVLTMLEDELKATLR